MEMYFPQMLLMIKLFLSKLKNVCLHQTLKINLKRNKLFKYNQFIKHQIYMFVFIQGTNKTWNLYRHIVVMSSWELTKHLPGIFNDVHFAYPHGIANTFGGGGITLVQPVNWT